MHCPAAAGQLLYSVAHASSSHFTNRRWATTVACAHSERRGPILDRDQLLAATGARSEFSSCGPRGNTLAAFVHLPLRTRRPHCSCCWTTFSGFSNGPMMRSAFSRVLPARCRRTYHNDTTLVRVAERFDISQPTDWYRLNRAAVVKEFPHDKEVCRCSKPTCAASMVCGAGAAGVQGAHLVGA